jgi:hypothetical protein
MMDHGMGFICSYICSPACTATSTYTSGDAALDLDRRFKFIKDERLSICFAGPALALFWLLVGGRLVPGNTADHPPPSQHCC